MKQMLKEIRFKGTSRKEESTPLNITHMHAFARNGKRGKQNTAEAGGDCCLCTGTRVVVHAPVECWDALVLELLGKNTA